MTILKCINKEPLPGNKIAPNLQVGHGYAILNIHVCGCGQHHYDVGLVGEDIETVTCYKCREVLPYGDSHSPIHWANSSRFSSITK